MRGVGSQFVQIVVVGALAGGGLALGVAWMREEPAPRRAPAAGSSAGVADRKAQIADLKAQIADLKERIARLEQMRDHPAPPSTTDAVREAGKEE